MRIEGVNLQDLASQYYYLTETGLDTFFTATALDDNSGVRYTRENRWRHQDLQQMLDKLNISQNKYFIIRLLRRGEITALLYFLQKDDKIQALNFFPRSKLIHFLNYMPKEMLIKMLLWVLPLKQILQFFPTDIIFHILRSKRLEVSNLVKGFENMPKEVLQKLMYDITGRSADNLGMRELLAMFRQLKKDQIIEGMKHMDIKHLFDFIHQEVKKDPELLMMIPRGEYLKLVATMPKAQLVELFRLLDENLLVMFLAQLPEKFLAAAAAMLDDKLFGELMISQYPDLIAHLAAAAA